MGITWEPVRSQSWAHPGPADPYMTLRLLVRTQGLEERWSLGLVILLPEGLSHLCWES